MVTDKRLRGMVREELKKVLFQRKRSNKLKDLLAESFGMTFIHCPPALGGTNPFGNKKKDNFTFRGLPGQVVEKRHVIKEDRDLDRVEELVDKYGLTKLLDLLSDVCYEKEEHVRGNWQDEKLAKQWNKAGKIIGGITTRVPNLP